MAEADAEFSDSEIDIIVNIVNIAFSAITCYFFRVEKSKEIKLPRRSDDETAHRRVRARLNRIKQGDRKVKSLNVHEPMPQIYDKRPLAAE